MNNKVDFTRLPEHIAIIMDGNGRYAKKRFLPRNAGHKAGAETLRRLCEAMTKNGFKQLTVFAFSTENWSRAPAEVEGLMSLLRDYIQRYIDDSKKNDTRIRVIGDMSRLDAELRQKIANLTEITKNHKGLNVNFAINYGGRDEIVRAAKKIMNAGILADEVSESVFSSFLDTSGMGDPDLIIRTGGEMRWSNFMLWQSAYSEMYFCDKLWPDFNYDDLLLAVIEYQNRERRYGG